MQNGDLIQNMYRILRPLGSGGIGNIYLAWHENLRKYIIVKKIKDHCVSLINSRSEADILKDLHHRYLPQVYDFVQIGQEVFTVMDYIPGHDLKYYLDSGQHFDEEQIIIWLGQLLEVLEYLHTQTPKIIHCDIKPANIMITEEGNVCLIDFNISLDGENNKELVGLSNQYASPEQVKKADHKLRYGSSADVPIDERSDLYSLGAVLYRMMTGITPNARRIDFIPISMVGKDVNPYSDGLTNIVDKAMQENPDKRFKSAARMKEAVVHIEKWGNDYRKLTRIGIGLDVTAFVLALVLVCMIIIGYGQMKTDEFFEAYSGYMTQVQTLYDAEMAANGDADLDRENARQILSDGISFLNDGTYKNKFGNYREAKSNVLYGVAQATMFLGDYNQALSYLEEALSYCPENVSLYRDLAIARIRCGEKEDGIVAEAVQMGMDICEIELIEAEEAYSSGDFERAYEKAVSAAENAMNSYEENHSEIMQRSALLAADSAQRCGAVSECIDFSVKMAGASGRFDKIFWLRKAGELCARRATFEKLEESYISQGISCYKEIQESGYAQLNDLYNLASLYEENGQFIDCRELLTEMYADTPDAYEIPLRLSSICYQIENSKIASKRDYNQTVHYFDAAKKICEASGLDWTSDSAMVQMNEIVEKLREKGLVRE